MLVDLKLYVIGVVLITNSWAKDDDADKCPEIVSKQRWGGRESVAVDYQILPVQYVIVHHTVTKTCASKSKCAEALTNIQNYHMKNLKFHDIGYNFIIGGDGRVYEGAGWHTIGAHTFGYNKKGLGLAFIGTFSDALPTSAALDAAKHLLRCGVELGELDPHYTLLGARQVSRSESPGLELYAEIQDWNNWSDQP